MKKFLTVVTTLLIAVIALNDAQAQSIKKYSGKKTVLLQDCGYRSIECQENYDYYGNHVKSGSYSLKGSANYRGTINATYSVTASYKNGLLNGHLSAKVTIKGHETGIFYDDNEIYDIDCTLSANFKEGIPDGQWIYSERGNSSIHRTTFNCKNGVFVGDFDCNFSSLKFPAKQKGKFDQDGKLLSIIIQGGGSRSKPWTYVSGIGRKEYNLKEYNLNSNGDLVSYFLRDEGKTVEKYQNDETLLKEYDEQNHSSIITSIKEKGYYLTRGEAQEKAITYDSYTFGTLTILNYIWQKLVLNESVDGVKFSDGFFSQYSYNICDIHKIPVKPLTEIQLSGLLEYIKRILNDEYRGYNEGMSKESVLAKCKKELLINRISTVDLIKISDTLRYFDDSQLVFFKDSVYRLWDDALENKRREREEKIQKAKNEVASNAKTIIIEIMDEVASWPIDTAVSEARNKLAKFHKVVSYKIDGIRVSDNFDTCVVALTINKKNKESYGYQTFKTNALFLNYRNIYQNFNTRLDNELSFEKCEHINNIWDTIKTLADTSASLKKQLLSTKKSFKNVYESYYKSVNPLNGDKENSQVQYDYWQNTISNQKSYLKFIELVKEIDNISDKIALKAKDENDIAKSYQKARKTWSLDVNEIITEDVKRLESYRDIQDSCLSFIELRKTISQNNAKIAKYSKSAPTIVKAHNTHMKGIDLTWNQEVGRNHAVREIIQIQNELITALSKPNISETDKAVKKSKAKNWEEVIKIVQQNQ